jgi:integrase
MSRPRSAVPSYRKHKQSGNAIVTLTDGLGGRRDILLGQHGSKESRVEYARVIAEWEAAGRTRPSSAAADLTINELILLYWPHVENHFRRPDGTQTTEVAECARTFKVLKRLYAHTAAKNFGPLALKSIRQAMIDGSWLTEAEKASRRKTGHKATWSRSVVNQRIGRIKRLFKWAVENEHVPASVFHGLQAVRGLQRGRSQARETARVKSVHPAFVEATLPFLRPQTAAMARLQLATGMRSGEVSIMRGIDLDTTGKIWLYRPGSDQGPAGVHKTAYLDQQRVVPIGPQGQAVLKPWLRLNLHEYLFQPKEAEAQRDAERRANRQTPLTPSQAKRRPKPKAAKAPGDHYTVSSYAHAVAQAVIRANAARACDACKKLSSETRCPNCLAGAIPHWHPHQLRHTKATEIRREAGLDAARAVLGHRSPAITEVYAELDLGTASDVMERLG